MKSTHHKSAYRFGVAASAMLAGLLSATPVLANEADEPQTGARNSDIVVTAQFREQKLQDTPLAITAVDADLMEARSQTDIVQVAAQAPNVQLTPLGGAYGPSVSIFIRGVGQNDFNPAYEPGVGMYIDDVYYPTLTGAVFDLLDLERVEILRGPQGTLTGRNSIGGAIKMISKEPGSGGGYVEGVYGSRNRMDLRASADFKIADGVNARISGVHKQQEGYVDQIDYGCANPGNAQGIGSNRSAGDCVVAKLGERNYSGIRGSLKLEPSSTFNLLIIGDYSKENRTNSADVVSVTNAAMAPYLCGAFCTYASFTAPPGNTLTSTTTQPNTTSFEGWGVSAKATLEVSDNLNIESITAYREFQAIWGTDDDFTPDPLIVGQGYNDMTHNFFSQELRLNGQVGDNIDFTVGAFISDQKTTYLTRQDIRYIVPTLPFLFLQFLGDDPVKADSKAVFGTVIVKPSEAMTITAGLRYTDESKSYTFLRKTYDRSSNALAFGVGALDGFTSTYEGNKLDWRISGDYRFSPAALAYVTIGTGFKGGGVSARPFNAAQAQLGSFDPETVIAYEVGLKTDLMDNRLRLNFAAFYNDYSDIQLPLVDCTNFGGPGPCGVRANAGDATYKGFEVELQAEPVDGLSIDGSLAYIDGKWKAGSLNPAVGAAINYADPVTTPKWAWSAGIQYRADMGASGSITPRFDIAYKGERFGGRSLGTPYYFDAYALSNARVTWRNADEDLSVSLEVQNLFDKYYFNSRFDAVYAFSGTAYSNVGRPREWALSVKKSF